MRALLSVYDKTGIVQFAKQLAELEVELVSSGGTASVIADAGLPVVDVAEYTGYPPMLGHRVVTLHPKVHGGILADRRDPSHLTDLENHAIDLIDIVVGNLYPFSQEPSVDLIDIGGPTLVRAAAKNHEYVTVLVDPNDYDTVLQELSATKSTRASTRSRLARKAFAHTAAYDASIVGWLDDTLVSGEEQDLIPETIHLSLERAQDLRYGENPHQQGARFRVSGNPSWWDSVIQHSGVEPSYLNLFDADAAWQLVHELGDSPACVIVKHANPCGAAMADDLATAYEAAFGCDPMSAFGGIVAVNRPIDDLTVAQIEAAAQADVIIAPGFEDSVVERLVNKRKNTRLLEAPAPNSAPLSVRALSDGFLVQQSHRFETEPNDWSVVTERKPSQTEMADAELAWKLCGHVTSNAIVLVKDRVAWGIGAGQQNRVEAGKLASAKAKGRAKGGACASDAFYPFRDGIDAAADAGAVVVVQPGGSVNDSETIAAANELGLSMIFTGERQFRH